MNHEDISIDNGAKANKFKFSSFFKLINSLKPHYSKLIIGTILGFIATAANLFVPQLAQRLINGFKNLSPNLIILTIVIFIGGLVISALSGLILGIFGEDVVAKLRKKLWQKMILHRLKNYLLQPCLMQ